MNIPRLGLPLALIVALAACSSPAAPPADEGGQPTPASETDAGGGGDTGDTDGGGDGGDASGYDLCEAITEEEVSEVTGTEVTESTSADMEGVLSCNYNAADGPVAGTTLTTSASGVDPQQMFDANRAEFEEVPGLGDGAVMAGDENFPILMVLVDGNLYSLSVLAENLDGQAKQEATIELARLSLDRLP